jgi:23S rRNA (cytidine2498-2'-O)-methyltransferase
MMNARAAQGEAGGPPPDAWPEGPVTGYVTIPGYEKELVAELRDAGAGEPLAVHGRLVLARGEAMPAAWAQNVWLAPERIEVESIGDAARKLLKRGQRWALLPHANFRRSSLIATKLPRANVRPLEFPAQLPDRPLGSFMLLDADTVVASARCSRTTPNGEIAFVEDHEGPPSRAYLKLWEALTLFRARPGPGERCADLGSSPGGWTWVAARLGGEVLSVDKAPLDPRVAELENVTFVKASAFGFDLAAEGPFDWVFWDVICYPAKLLRRIDEWLAQGVSERFVCTVKFQGETDMAAVRELKAIPGSKLVHLNHNQHELTWVKLPGLAGT